MPNLSMNEIVRLKHLITCYNVIAINDTGLTGRCTRRRENEFILTVLNGVER